MCYNKSRVTRRKLGFMTPQQTSPSQSLEYLEARTRSARSNKLLNARIKACGGSDKIAIGRKNRNTYAVVANMNNVAVKGKTAHVIQLTEGVKQTREAYSTNQLAQMEFQELLEAKALATYSVTGHAEIVQTVDRVLSDVSQLVNKYSRSC